MSSKSKSPSSNGFINNNNNNNNSEEEESGWTTYFEDYFDNNIDDEKCSNIAISCTSSSFVSDAASLAVAPKKLADDDNNDDGDEFCGSNKKNIYGNNMRILSFKKRKKAIQTMVDDDSLEDTATSPLNSPKVYWENQLHQPKQKEKVHLSQEKGNYSGEERKELGFIGRDSDCTELKKRGLCLVPLSMVVNYLG